MLVRLPGGTDSSRPGEALKDQFVVRLSANVVIARGEAIEGGYHWWG